MMEYIKIKTIEEYIEEYKQYMQGLDKNRIICKYLPVLMEKVTPDIGMARDSESNQLLGEKGIKYNNNHELSFKEGYLKSVKKMYMQFIKKEEYEKIANHIRENIIGVFWDVLYEPIWYVWEDLFISLQYSLGDREKVDFPLIVESLVSKENLPFEDCCKKTANFVIPLKKILGNEKYITVFNIWKDEKVGKRLDVHGYWKLKKCEEELKKEVGESNNFDNYLLLEEILGISITNSVFWITRKINKESKEKIFRIAGILARLKNRYARMAMTELVMNLLVVADFEEKVCNIIADFIIKFVENFNECYDKIVTYYIGKDYFDKKISTKVLMEDIEEMKKDANIQIEDKYQKRIARIVKKREIRVTKGMKSDEEYYAQLHIEIMRSIWREKSQGVGLKKKMTP